MSHPFESELHEHHEHHGRRGIPDAAKIGAVSFVLITLMFFVPARAKLALGITAMLLFAVSLGFIIWDEVTAQRVVRLHRASLLDDIRSESDVV